MGWLLPAIADVTMVAAPASGATVVIPQGTTLCFINNASLLLTLTVTLPTNPVDGQRLTICSAASVTALTVNGGTINGAASTLGVNGYARYAFSATVGAWFRTG